MWKFDSIEDIADLALVAWRKGRDRGDGRLPRWRDISFRDLTDLTNRMYLVKYGADDNLQLRYRGQDMDEFFGPRSPAMLVVAEDRRAAIRGHRLCMSHPCGAIFRRRAEAIHFAGNLSPIDFNLLFLPALDEDGKSDLLLAFGWYDKAALATARKLSNRVRVHFHRIEFLDLGFGVPEPDHDPGIVTEVELPEIAP